MYRSTDKWSLKNRIHRNSVEWLLPRAEGWGKSGEVGQWCRHPGKHEVSKTWASPPAQPVTTVNDTVIHTWKLCKVIAVLTNFIVAITLQIYMYQIIRLHTLTYTMLPVSYISINLGKIYSKQILWEKKVNHQLTKSQCGGRAGKGKSTNAKKK